MSTAIWVLVPMISVFVGVTLRARSRRPRRRGSRDHFRPPHPDQYGRPLTPAPARRGVRLDEEQDGRTTLEKPIPGIQTLHPSRWQSGEGDASHRHGVLGLNGRPMHDVSQTGGYREVCRELRAASTRSLLAAPERSHPAAHGNRTAAWRTAAWAHTQGESCRRAHPRTTCLGR